MTSVYDSERLPFPAGMFDLVTAAGSLNYADVPAALTEIARVLARTGRSCCTTSPPAAAP
jgi:ubiquinone/menaquinone biosynthesis C-methylase UbiE